MLVLWREPGIQDTDLNAARHLWSDYCAYLGDQLIEVELADWYVRQQWERIPDLATKTVLWVRPGFIPAIGFEKTIDRFTLEHLPIVYTPDRAFLAVTLSSGNLRKPKKPSQLPRTENPFEWLTQKHDWHNRILALSGRPIFEGWTHFTDVGDSFDLRHELAHRTWLDRARARRIFISWKSSSSTSPTTELKP
jgi:hypothetical protein